jgi:protein phosphatase
MGRSDTLRSALSTARDAAVSNGALATCRLPRLIYARSSIAGDNHPRHNEDRLLIAREAGLAAVFDGVGGSAAGEVAAHLAAQAVRLGWQRIRERQPAAPEAARVPSTAALDLPAALSTLLLRAHQQIRAAEPHLTSHAERPPAGARGGATTAAVIALTAAADDTRYRLGYAWVGDSRIYLLAAGQPLRRLTSDDGVLTGLVHEGMLSEPDALRIDQACAAEQLSDLEHSYFKLRNGITQALGERKTPSVHAGQRTCGPGDRILLCSDGIHDNLTDRELERVLRLASPASAARELVGYALRRSREERGISLRAKSDDMSAITIVCGQ